MQPYEMRLLRSFRLNEHVNLVLQYSGIKFTSHLMKIPYFNSSFLSMLAYQPRFSAPTFLRGGSANQIPSNGCTLSLLLSWCKQLGSHEALY